MRHEPLAHIALHSRPQDVLQDAVMTARRLTGSDAAFAAVASGQGGYGITVRDGLFEQAWTGIIVRHGRGLGGRVLSETRPLIASDYLCSREITGDYREVVRAEGLAGIACAPIAGPQDAAALLYVGDRALSYPGDRLLGELARIADMATVGLVVSERLAGAPGPSGPRADAGIHLTPRERDVLALLADGCSNREIAAGLFLAEATVKGYVKVLFEKLSARSRLDVVAQARRRGLV